MSHIWDRIQNQKDESFLNVKTLIAKKRFYKCTERRGKSYTNYQEAEWHLTSKHKYQNVEDNIVIYHSNRSSVKMRLGGESNI